LRSRARTHAVKELDLDHARLAPCLADDILLSIDERDYAAFAGRYEHGHI
jgi:hypothetical protein